MLGGWEPQGTQHYGYDEFGGPLDGDTPDPNWAGHYFSNDGQIVTAKDARNLAKGLELALPDVPDYEATDHKIGKRVDHGGEVMYFIEPDTPINPFEWFSGEEKKELISFIRFVRESKGFWIF